MSEAAGNAQKTPFPLSMHQFTADKIAAALALTGKRLPVEVVTVDQAIVTVKFLVKTQFTLPQIKVPVEQAIYVRLPIQVGDLGWVQAADTYIGNISGLGGSEPPDLTVRPGNLAALVFSPISSSDWPDLDDTDSLVLQGPNGVSLWDIGKETTIVLTPAGLAVVGRDSITLTVGSSSITINSSGVSIAGTLTINGKPYLAHEHSGVQTGGSFSGGVHDP